VEEVQLLAERDDLEADLKDKDDRTPKPGSDTVVKLLEAKLSEGSVG